MVNFYEKGIEKYILSHSVISKTIITEKFGQALELHELRDLSQEESRSLYFDIKKAILLDESAYDLTKLATAIQDSTGGTIGGAAMTTYTCLFCNNQQMHSSTAVPKICWSCAKDMAQNIVLREEDLLKD